MKGDTLARIRNRESWVSIREIPPVEPTLSAESTMVKCGDETVDATAAQHDHVGDDGDDNDALEPPSLKSKNNSGKKRYIRRPTPRYQPMSVDHRQDEGNDDKDSVDNDSTRQSSLSSNGDMGFEVQMSSRGSGSSNGGICSRVDNVTTENSSTSSLDYLLDELRRSASNSANGFTNFGKNTCLETVSTPPTCGRDNVDVSTKARNSLFVDINNAQQRGNGSTHDAREETPRATNRSENTRASKLLHSPLYKMTLKNKKKEAVVDTLATVILEVENATDSCDSTNSMDQQVNSTDTDDSSAQVDARWESYHAKYAIDHDKPNRNPNKVGSSNDDIGDQQLWRDTLLDVNSFPSSASVASGSSETFEDLLIQDCIETGLPSPDKRRERKAKGNYENKAAVFFPDSEHDTSRKEPTLSSSSHLPAISQRCEDFSTREVSEGTPKINDHGQNPAIVHSVTSILTGNEDCGNGHSSTVPPIHSSCSEMDSMKEHEANPRLRRTVPSQSEDGTIHDDLVPTMESLDVEGTDLNQDVGVTHPTTLKKMLFLPKKALMEDYDEDIQTPKIEITLVPSSSVSEDTISDVSDSSCAKIQRWEQPPHEGNCSQTIKLTAQRLPLHEQDEKTQGSKGGLHWWRKNGKRLVEEKVGALPPPTMKLRSFQPPTMKAWGGIHQPRDIDLGPSESFPGEQLPSNNNNKKEPYVSAFKRGISMFEKRQSQAPTPTSPPREAKKFGWSTEAHSTEPNTLQQGRKSIHAPQPMPDADGSNSVTHGRRNKRFDDGKETDSIADSHIPTQEADDVGRDESRFLRPGHEDSSGDGAIGLGPSPKMRTEVGHDDAPPVMEVVKPNDHVIMSPSSLPLQLDETKHFFASHDIVSADSEDENDYTADILDVASTLTDETTSPAPGDNYAIIETSQNTISCNPTTEERTQKTVTVVLGCHKEPILDSTSTVYIPSWRLPPSDNLSDFVIQAQYKALNTNDVHYVHKHILGVGPRRSEFLEEIFRSSDASTVQITLEDEASIYLPDILDYVYNPKFELEMTTENVLAYRYLARVFKIFPVIRESSEFVLQDMKIENMSTYISDSFRFRDEIVTNVIAAKCGEEIENIAVTDILWTVMDPSLFLRIISCPKIDRKKVSSQLSLLLKEYYTLHKYEMTEKIFQQVSTIALMPLIHREAALPLLEICEEFGAPVSLHPLQKRCAQVMACYWKTTSEADRRCLFALLRSLPSHFTVDFLELVESGNTMAWLNAPLSKALRESKRNAQNNSDGYENTDSFSVAKLCGDDFSHYEIHEPLSWRMDPVLSFSDWTFKVKHRNDDKVDVYHVHKHILSLGPYKSTFFADMFLGDDQKSSRTGTTIIELAQGPTELIPVVFDFLYSSDHDLVITSRTACALSFLSRVLGIWMLNKKVIEYVQRDIDLTTMLRYIDDAELYDDERIMNIAIRKCAVGIKGIDPESDLLHGMKPDFFGRIIASSDIDKNASCHVNILIAKYFTMHELDEGLLGELMKQVPMKECDRDSALKLLDVMSSVKAQGIAIFAEIRKRCVDVLIESWKDIRESKREEAINILRTLDTTLVVDVFDAVENEYFKRHNDNMSVQSKLVKRYRAQLAEVKEKRDEEMARMQNDHETMVSELLRKHDELEAELAVYRDATSRRALRSCGGFPHAPSPRRHTVDASRQSFIPRLNPKAPGLASPKSTAETPKNKNDAVQAPTTAGSSSSSAPQIPPSTAMTSMEQHSSLFGRVFGCSPQSSASNQNAISTGLVATHDQQEGLIGGHDGIANKH